MRYKVTTEERIELVKDINDSDLFFEIKYDEKFKANHNISDFTLKEDNSFLIRIDKYDLWFYRVRKWNKDFMPDETYNDTSTLIYSWEGIKFIDMIEETSGDAISAFLFNIDLFSQGKK